MRENLSDRECLIGLVKLARELPQYESLLCSTISYIATTVYENDRRERLAGETFKVESRDI